MFELVSTFLTFQAHLGAPHFRPIRSFSRPALSHTQSVSFHSYLRLGFRDILFAIKVFVHKKRLLRVLSHTIPERGLESSLVVRFQDRTLTIGVRIGLTAPKNRTQRRQSLSPSPKRSVVSRGPTLSKNLG